jgi:hypothetical protein
MWTIMPGDYGDAAGKAAREAYFDEHPLTSTN